MTKPETITLTNEVGNTFTLPVEDIGPIISHANYTTVLMKGLAPELATFSVREKPDRIKELIKEALAA